LLLVCFMFLGLKRAKKSDGIKVSIDIRMPSSFSQSAGCTCDTCLTMHLDVRDPCLLVHVDGCFFNSSGRYRITWEEYGFCNARGL
jgi:hypothetical protein